MNKWQKIGLAVGMGTAVITTTHLINSIIFKSSTANNYTGKRIRSNYQWKFGNIAYITAGSGSPLLLIHDLNSYSSSYEWEQTINSFAKNHKVYAIDLLGCGHSDKPNLTYTTFMYTQLINDFVLNVIRSKTDVVATAGSTPIVIMAAFNNHALFNKIILVSPLSVEDALKGPDNLSGIRRHILAQKDMKLRGVHNCENACAAIAATASLVSVEEQIKTIEEFSGVEHRLELVRNINGINWYNDSIGTSPSRTIAGLNSFNEKIVLIAGGYDKHLDYMPIAKPIVDNVSKLILMGATADKIHDAVVKELTLEQKSMPIYHCSTLKETVELANKIVEKGEIVLFSPASASFDLFKNFAERGDKFKELVNGL